MGGKVTGHRIMVTVPEDVYPLLEKFSEIMGVPVATAMRILLKEIAPTMRFTIERFNQARSGDETGALLGLSVDVLQSTSRLNASIAESLRDPSAASISMFQVPTQVSIQELPEKPKKKA